jgi:Calx-beta domain
MRISPWRAVPGTAVLFLILAGTASAACQNTYSGPAGGEWNTDANWTLGAKPTSAQDACIPAGTTVQIVEGAVSTAKSLSIAAGAKLTIRTDPGFSSTQASFGDVDNAGTIELTSTGMPIDNDQNELRIAAGHTLTNRGLLRAAQTEGYTVIYGDVDTTATGSLQVDGRLRVAGNGERAQWSNAGAVTVGAGQTLSFESGWGSELRQTGGTYTNHGETVFTSPDDTLAASGGAFTGTPPLLHQGSLALTGGTGTARIQYGAASLASDIASGWTVRIEDRGSDTTRLTVPGGAARTNAGTILFAHDPAPGTDRVGTLLDIAGGGSLTNTGTIRAAADVSAGPAITAARPPGSNVMDTAAFKQNGSLEAQHSLTTPPFTQRGTTTVDAGVRLTVGNPFEATDPGLALAAGTLTGNGNVRARKVTNTGGVVAPAPGGTPLTLAYNNIYETEVAGGDYIQQSGGTLRTRLAASGSGLFVGGQVKLAGTWNVAAASGSTPPAGQTYPVVRTQIPESLRSGTFDTVSGDYAPTYERDGADVTVPSPDGSPRFSVADEAVKEGQTLTFTVKRSGSGGGTAAVHWSARDTGSAVAGADYPQAPGAHQISGDLAFADGETEKTVTALWTLDEGNPEPDETFQFHLSHPENVPIGRATATATILNDDSNLASVAPNRLGDDGPTTLSLRGQGLTSRMTVLLRHGGRPDMAPVSLVASDDGSSATAVFDTTGATPLDGGWYVEARNQGNPGGYQFVTLEHATGTARPYVQAAGAPYARGGLPSDDYLHYGNLGTLASRPAFLRLTGYPTGADLTVDHVPPGAQVDTLDGISGRTVTVSLGRIPARANEYLRIRYVPTTTIPGHTKLKLQAALTFGDAIAPPSDVRTLSSTTLLTPAAGELLSANLGFSPAGQVHLRYAEKPADASAPVITHSGSTWTFRGTPKVVDAAPREDVPYSQGLVTVDFNGGQFNISGPLNEVEGAYELSIDRHRLTECMKDLHLLTDTDYDDLNRLADGAVVMKGMVTAAGASGAIKTFAPQLGALDAVMSGAWEYRVAGGKSAILDHVANEQLHFDQLDDDEYQMLWLMQLCRPKPKPEDIPEPEYDDKGNFIPPPFVKELLQSYDPNEKSGTQGGGGEHAVRSDSPIQYRVGFQNLPGASAAAQTVKVTDQLDPAKVDLTTFRLGPIAFGDQLLTPPDGVTRWTSTVDLRPATDLLVKVEAALDSGTGKVTWTFTSLDPETGQPTTDARAGFLPPDTHPPDGEGIVGYAVAPKAGIASGTKIAGDASIVFDTNAPLVTNVWSNLIDDDAPSGSVTSVEPASCGALDVAWSGADATSGVASYDVWVSKDGGTWWPWRFKATGTSSRFSATAGHAYRFDVQARDLAGNLQSAARGDARGATATCPSAPGGGGAPGGQPPAPGGPPAVQPPAKPWITLGKLPRKLVKGRLAVRLTCPKTEASRCRGRLKLTARIKRGKRKVTVTLGTARFSVRPGKAATVKLKLGKKAVRLLRAGALNVALTATGGDPRHATRRGRLARLRR